MYKRFIDDLFFIWRGSQEKATEFTANYSSKEIESQDLNISIENKWLHIHFFFFFKVDINSYLFW